MRHGHTFIELALALAVAGLALGIALPRLAEVQDGLEVDRAAREVASAHRRARIAALVRSRPVVLTISPDSLAYRVAGTSVGLWRAPGPARDGVVLVSPPRQITFSPVGITMGLANASFRFLRGSASRTVVLSRLGRVRITRP
jgi:Tfp pilus assembly protein FimT